MKLVRVAIHSDLETMGVKPLDGLKKAMTANLGFQERILWKQIPN